MSKFKPTLSYANVVATMALVFSMTGGALAARHYLVNSTKQINPKVLKKLHGAKGPAGEQGSKGATGAVGATGATGNTGKEGKQGPQGVPGTATNKGETGATGPTGPAGEEGGAGTTGATGPTGPTGEAGEAGATGGTGGTGGTGEAGPTGPTGEKGEPGEKGTAGEAGSALAYGHVSAGFILSAEKNIGEVEEDEEKDPGVFCITGIVGTTHTVVASLDYNESAELSGIAATLGRGIDEVCPSGTQVTVETFEIVSGKAKGLSQGFYLEIN
jgi:hypothetical protein